MSIRMICPDCGRAGSYKTPALAEFHFPRHSCRKARAEAERRERVEARAAAEGVKRDCRCKRANHRHGTSTAYVVDKCRCRACRDAVSAKAAERARAQLYGRYDRFVDATEAREHLRSLLAQGMGPKRIAEVSGIGHGSISAILYGKPMRDPKEARAPRKRITRTLHERVMAVRLDLADGAVVDSTGTTRRLQALVAIGWPQARLAARLNMSGTNLGGLVHGHRDTTHAVAQAVKALYDDLWDQPLAGTSGNRARAYAARHGWAVPLAWDEDQLDDPTATPHTAAATRGSRLLEDVEWLLDQGHTRTDIPTRLHTSYDTIANACKRAGRDDLWRRYRDSDDRRTAA